MCLKVKNGQGACGKHVVLSDCHMLRGYELQVLLTQVPSALYGAVRSRLVICGRPTLVYSNEYRKIIVVMFFQIQTSFYSAATGHIAILYYIYV